MPRKGLFFFIGNENLPEFPIHPPHRTHLVDPMHPESISPSSLPSYLPKVHPTPTQSSRYMHIFVFDFQVHCLVKMNTHGSPQDTKHNIDHESVSSPQKVLSLQKIFAITQSPVLRSTPSIMSDYSNWSTYS